MFLYYSASLGVMLHMVCLVLCVCFFLCVNWLLLSLVVGSCVNHLSLKLQCILLTD